MRKQTSSYSRSASTRSNNRQTISFQTIFKRRNETINAAQVYDSPTSKYLRHHTHSNTVDSEPEPREHLKYRDTPKQKDSTKQKDTPKQKEVVRQPNIREYVKQMGIKKEGVNPANQRRPSEGEDDYRSQKTSRTNVSSYSAAPEMRPVTDKGSRTIEELQNKIEGLISQTIQVLKQQRGNIGLKKWAQIRKSSSLDQDFLQIEGYLNEMRAQTVDDEQYSDKLAEMNKRIELVEKMIAGQTVESEVLRQQYYSWKNQRTNTTSFSNKKLLGSVSKFNKSTQGGFNPRKETSGYNLATKASVTRFDSTNKLSFKKPAKEYYLNLKPKNNSYSLNRQPLERSSYSTQYLSYGYIPTYCHKADSVVQFSGNSLAVKASTYQHEYKEKLGLNKTISVKDLDCYYDKFKNPNISFMEHSKKTKGVNFKKGHKESNKENSSSLSKANNRNYDPSLIASMNMTTTGDFYKSEQKKEYVWHSRTGTESARGGKEETTGEMFKEETKEEMLKSQIKDKKMLKMKESFRNLAMQR